MEDEHYLLIDGRRWRRTDPAIPENLRAELVAELMAARREVGAALWSRDAEAEAAARTRVGDAKVALGERGERWWEGPTPQGLAQRVPAAARALLRRRAPATICPSDVARVVGGAAWRSSMAAVRTLLIEQVDAGVLELRQKGRAVRDPGTVKGPIRFAAGDGLMLPGTGVRRR